MAGPARDEPPERGARSSRADRGAGARPLVGWREWVALPELGVEALKAKVDTGARTSSLHAFDVEEFRRGGRTMVRFKVHPEQRSSQPVVEAVAPLCDRRAVRTSGGEAEQRPVIRTTLQLHGERWDVELTLARRDVMGFRMLLGRQALRGRFVVDPGRSFLAGRRRRRKGGRR